MDSLYGQERRNTLRFPPGISKFDAREDKSIESLAYIDTELKSSFFEPRFLGLLLEKSYTGCSVVLVCNNGSGQELAPGSACLVKAGSLFPMQAIVRWRKNIDNRLIKVGFQFVN